MQEDFTPASPNPILTSQKKEEFPPLSLSTLPHDVQIEILQFLEGKDVLSMCCVDWYWNEVASDSDSIWKPLCRKRWEVIHISLYQGDWKTLWMTNNSRWPFVLGPEQSKIVQLSNNALTIEKIAQNPKRRYITIIGDMALRPNTGKYHWNYRLDQSEEFSSFVKFGICTNDFDAKESLAFSTHGWGYCRGYKWHKPQTERLTCNVPYGLVANPGDIIGVEYDSKNVTLGFWHNGKYQGIAFDSTFLPKDVDFWPAVTLDAVHDRVTMEIPQKGGQEQIIQESEIQSESGPNIFSNL